MPKPKSRYCCLVESRGAATEIGLAHLDVENNECILAQFSDIHSYNGLCRQILLNQPELIILQAPGHLNSEEWPLLSLLKHRFQECEFITIKRPLKCFLSGTVVLKELSIKQDIEKLLLLCEKKFYTIVAISGLFGYFADEDFCPFHPHSIKFKVESREGTMMIDYHTAKSLELVRGLEDEGWSLMKSIDRTKSKMGKRLLRSMILQPSTSISTIRARNLAFKGSFFKCPRENQFMIDVAMSELPDLGQLIGMLAKKPPTRSIKSTVQRLKVLAKLMKAVKLGKEIAMELENSKETLLSDIFKAISNDELLEIKEIIESKLNPDIDYSENMNDNQLCHLIRPGMNGLLDVSRKALHETTQDIVEYASTIANQINLDIKVKFTNNHKFVLCFKESSEKPKYITKLSNGQYTTVDLIKLNERIREAMEEIFLITGQMIDEICEKISENLPPLYFLSEGMAFLDVLLSMSNYYNEYPSHKCQITTFGTEFDIFEGLNPVLLSQTSKTFPISFQTQDYLFFLITGANMSGKTTFLKSIAYFQIMSQIGYPIPTQRSTLKLFNRLCTRLGSDDDLESNASTFSVEMREAAYFISEADENCLILIDELGRGTSTISGLSLTMAICEKLLLTKATVFFVTHFDKLTSYICTFPNAKLLKFDDDNRLNARNVNEVNYGGIHLAKLINMDDKIIEEAIHFHSILTQQDRKNNRIQNNLTKKANKRRLVLRVALRIMRVALYSNLPEDDIIEEIKTLRDEFNNSVDNL